MVERFASRRDFDMWWRTTVVTGVLAVALTASATLATVASAGPPHMGAAHTVVSTADPEFAASADAAGVAHGFVNATNSGYGSQLTYFRASATSIATRTAPYTGQVIATAWDGSDATYVVYARASTLYIAVHHDRSATFSHPTVLTTSYTYGGADVVASAGKWWVVWAEWDGSHTSLYQRRTLLGSGERTHAVSTPAGSNDMSPSLAYASGKATMVWARTPRNNAWPAHVELGTSTGALFSASTLVGGEENNGQQVAVSAGHTYVAFEHGTNRMYEKDNSTGTWVTHEFATHGLSGSVAVAGGVVYQAWSTVDARVFLAARYAGNWAGSVVTGVGAGELEVLAGPAGPTLLYGTPHGLHVRFS
jgi:hypothetical protein